METASPSLCSPGLGLTCFACCPPIRPPGYDHLDHRRSLTRLFSDNRRDFLAGRLPDRTMLGFFCPGLGFLDALGHGVGCLYHPARHGGDDLRLATGYRDKCARESCPPARAYALLEPGQHLALIETCAGLDAFQFSSPRANPLLRLLALGPRVAAAAAGLDRQDLLDMAQWPWLAELPPAWGWFLGLMLAARGPGALLAPDLVASLRAALDSLTPALGPAPPLEQGPLLAELCDEWEARFWRGLTGRSRLAPGRLAAWRGLAGQTLGLEAPRLDPSTGRPLPL